MWSSSLQTSTIQYPSFSHSRFQMRAIQTFPPSFIVEVMRPTSNLMWTRLKMTENLKVIEWRSFPSQAMEGYETNLWPPRMQTLSLMIQIRSQQVFKSITPTQKPTIYQARRRREETQMLGQLDLGEEDDQKEQSSSQLNSELYLSALVFFRFSRKEKLGAFLTRYYCYVCPLFLYTSFHSLCLFPPSIISHCFSTISIL